MGNSLEAFVHEKDKTAERFTCSLPFYSNFSFCFSFPILYIYRYIYTHTHTHQADARKNTHQRVVRAPLFVVISSCGSWAVATGNEQLLQQSICHITGTRANTDTCKHTCIIQSYNWLNDSTDGSQALALATLEKDFICFSETY